MGEVCKPSTKGCFFLRIEWSLGAHSPQTASLMVWHLDQTLELEHRAPPIDESKVKCRKVLEESWDGLTWAELPTYTALNHLIFSLATMKTWDVPFFLTLQNVLKIKPQLPAASSDIISFLPSYIQLQAQWPCCLIHSNAPSNGSKGAGCAVAKPKPKATARSMRGMTERGRSKLQMDFCPKGARGARDSKAWDSRQADLFTWPIASGNSTWLWKNTILNRLLVGKFSNSMGHLFHS